MSYQFDHVFMAQTSGQAWLVFCHAENESKETARRKIKDVLETEKRVQIAMLNYMGVVDITNMDQEIVHQLYHFEKYDPVWLLAILSSD